MARHRFVIKTKGSIDMQLAVSFPTGLRGTHDADEYVKAHVKLSNDEELWRLSNTGNREYQIAVQWHSDVISSPN